MSSPTRCARFHAVGTLPISGFNSEDTLGLEASCRVVFAIAKEKKPHTMRERHGTGTQAILDGWIQLRSQKMFTR